MAEAIGKEKKKEVMKDILKKLHQGLSAEEAKKRFEKEIGTVTSTEIAEIEQSLMNEGISTDEIKKFCNVHALLFESALQESMAQEESPAHPLFLSKLENREVEKITAGLKEAAKGPGALGVEQIKGKLKELLTRLQKVDIHYTWKEQVLFPYLEKAGFYGPSKVMWGKDDEIRDLLKRSLSGLDGVKEKKDLEGYIQGSLNPLVDEVEGMISKEEKILFPASREKLSVQDWVEVLKETEHVGYAFIQKPKETSELIAELKRAVVEEPRAKESEDLISLPTGELKLEELLGIFNTLPVDVSFIDKEDRVRYFSEGPQRIFLRTKSILGRKVQNCHPPKSVDVVEKILQSFKEGLRKSADFWIHLQGKYIYIRYFPVRDRQGNYLGTLEVSQEISGIQKIGGERRLLDWN
jgi:uncharacterized protein